MNQLPLMRVAFCTSVSDGQDKLYEIRFKFTSLQMLQDAYREWVHWTAAQQRAVTAMEVSDRERPTRRCVEALAFAARTLLECELSMKAHPQSSVALSRKQAEEALAGMGVTWCPLRGWVVSVAPAGAAPLASTLQGGQDG